MSGDINKGMWFKCVESKGAARELPRVNGMEDLRKK